MALIVETGAGLPDAESYISVVEFRAYCAGLGFDVTALTDQRIEELARGATGYVDSQWLFKGVVANHLQALEFPRAGLSWSGREVVGIPKRLKDAVASLMLAGRDGPLRAVLERGGAIQSESVGPISVTYFAGAPGGVVYDEAAMLLGPYTKSKSTVHPIPRFIEAAAPPAITLGMQAQTGGLWPSGGDPGE